MMAWRGRRGRAGQARHRKERCRALPARNARRPHEPGQSPALRKRPWLTVRRCRRVPCWRGETLGLRTRIYLQEGAMSYSPALIAHICGGSLGLLSGTAAMTFRKGSPGHVLAGKGFFSFLFTLSALPTVLSL